MNNPMQPKLEALRKQTERGDCIFWHYCKGQDAYYGVNMIRPDVTGDSFGDVSYDINRYFTIGNEWQWSSDLRSATAHAALVKMGELMEWFA